VALWKVYDAVIQNVSIVNNYRSQFERMIARSWYEELKRIVREKAQYRGLAVEVMIL
jgi:phospholipid transport system substrate-binding protein